MTVIDWSLEAAEKGGYEHVHAQGDPRAARVAAPGHRRPGDPRRTTSGSRSWRASRTTLRADRPGRARSPAGRRRTPRWSARPAIQDWVGIPARVTVGSEFRYSPPPHRRADAGHRGHPVRRDGRHDRPDPARARARLRRSSRSPTPSAGDHPRGGRGPVPAGRAGDRGRRVQDVRDPGHDAGHPGGGHRQGPRDARGGAGAGARGRAPRAAGGGGAGARDRPRGVAGPGPPLRQLARLHVRRPRLHATRRRSRARSSSRRSATSTPRATPPAR